MIYIHLSTDLWLYFYLNRKEELHLKPKLNVFCALSKEYYQHCFEE